MMVGNIIKVNHRKLRNFIVRNYKNYYSLIKENVAHGSTTAR